MAERATAGGRRRATPLPRCVATLSAGLLALPSLAGCTSSDDSEASDGAVQSVAAGDREGLRAGGGVTWGVDELPVTLNAFQHEADPVTDRIAQAVLPQLFTLDAAGTPEANPDYLESVEVTDHDPRLVVRYTLHPEARWSNGKPLGAADFVSQWQALSGQDSAYWSARNAGYDRIETVEDGDADGEVVVTFAEPYADWESLFTPLYPRSVTGDPDAFNAGSRDVLPVSGGPFEISTLDRERGRLSLVPNDAWWGDPAMLEALVFARVPREERLAAMARGDLHVAEVDPSDADRIDAAAPGGQDEATDEDGTGQADSGTPEESRADGAALDAGDRDDAAGTGAAAGEPDGTQGTADGGQTEPRERTWDPTAPADPPGAADPADPSDVPGADTAGADTADAADAEATDTEVDAEDGPENGPGDGPEDGSGGAAAPNTPASSAPALLQLAEARIAGEVASDAREEELVARATEEYAAALVTEQRARDQAFAAREDEISRQLGAYTVHRAYAPSYTQLALNGSSEALADERVRWALTRSLDREEIAATVHEPAGLPARPAGNHLWVHGQQEYQDNSERLGTTGPAPAAELLDAAGWFSGPGGGALRVPLDGTSPGTDAGAEAEAGAEAGAAAPPPEAGPPAAPATVPVRLGAAVPAAEQRAAVLRLAATVADAVSEDGAYDRLSEPADATARAAAEAGREAADLARGSAAAVRVRHGTPLQLRFVLPDEGPGVAELRTVGERIVRMLADVGVHAQIDEVEYERYFSDHVAEGDFDLALYSWPATAWPATDARPIFAKPQPIPGGELFVEQNYSRVGTDHIDQLLDRAGSEMDEERRAELLNDADTRIWGAAGSVPLYQSPELVAADRDLAGVGAFGLETPRFQDIGYRAEP